MKNKNKCKQINNQDEKYKKERKINERMIVKDIEERKSVGKSKVRNWQTRGKMKVED